MAAQGCGTLTNSTRKTASHCQHARAFRNLPKGGGSFNGLSMHMGTTLRSNESLYGKTGAPLPRALEDHRNNSTLDYHFQLQLLA